MKEYTNARNLATKYRENALGAESNIFKCLFFIFFNQIFKQYMWKGQRRQTYKYNFDN